MTYLDTKKVIIDRSFIQKYESRISSLIMRKLDDISFRRKYDEWILE